VEVLMDADLNIEDLLAEVDVDLADREVALADRPLLATMDFVSRFVVAVGSGESEAPVPTAVTEVVTTDWFSALFWRVSDWYVERHGSMARPGAGHVMIGFATFDGIPLALRIPATTSKVEIPGKTAWMTFQGGVAATEEPIEWVVNGAALLKREKEAVRELRAAIAEQATALRRIHCALIGASSDDKVLRGLLRTLRLSLEFAATIGGTVGEEDLAKGYWELQVALECSLKAVSQVKRGTFTRTHDLFTLYDDLPKVALGIDRQVFTSFPRWKDVASLRYGQADAGARRDYLAAFQLAIKTIANILQPIVRLKLAGGALLLARPPWYRHIDEADLKANHGLRQSGPGTAANGP
jgi:hypothetical protein